MYLVDEPQRRRKSFSPPLTALLHDLMTEETRVEDFEGYTQ